MDCDVDAGSVAEGKQKTAKESTSVEKQAVVSMDLDVTSTEKKPEEDDASSSVSSGPPANPEGEGDKSPKSEIVGTRKSKRQVKVTNKFRDFVVDAPLPSSQVPYADIKLARGNGGGRKSHVKEPEPLSPLDDSPPESPPMIIFPPVRTYSNKKAKSTPVKEEEQEEKPKRRITRSGTPIPREVRTRKKKEPKVGVSQHWLEPDDETIELPGPDDKNDSTLTLNLDSSYFTDDEALEYDSPSPDEFCGWPEEEFNNLGAGPSSLSFSTVSTISVVASDPSIAVVQPVEEDTSGVDEKSEPDSPVIKRRGRQPRMLQPKLLVPIVEPTVRPAEHTFIKRSYKTTRSSIVTSLPTPIVSPIKTRTEEPKTPIKKPTIDKVAEVPQVAVVPEPPEVVKPTDTTDIENVLDDAIEIVLQADEIINEEAAPLETSASVLSIVSSGGTPKPPRNRRRIRGGSRLSPADGTPRRGRSRKDTVTDPDDEPMPEVKPVSEIQLIEAVDTPEVKIETPMEVDEPVKAPMEQIPEKIDEVEPPKTLVVETSQEIPVEKTVTKPEAPPEPTPTKTEKLEKSVKKSPKKSKSKPESKDSKRDTSSESRKSESKTRKQRSQTTPVVALKKEPDSVKESPGSTPKSHDSGEVIILDSKDIIPSESIKTDTPTAELKEVVPVVKEVVPVVKEVAPAVKEAVSTVKELTPVKILKETVKESTKENKESKKDRTPKESKKSKESREHSSKKSKERDLSRKERDSSKGSKERDKNKDRKKEKSSESSKKDRRSEVSESEKKRSDSKEQAEKKVDPGKKRSETLGKKPAEAEKKVDPDKKSSEPLDKKSAEVEKKVDPDKKRSEAVDKKPAEVEKKDDKPATPVPKATESKPKKCFDMELQAMDPTPKHKPVDESKRSKDQEKSRKSDKHKHRSESESKKKSSSESKSSKERKGKSRSTDTSPIPSKHSSSSSKKAKEASSGSKRDSSAGESKKSRKSLTSSLKEEKPKEESAVKKEKTKEKVKEVAPPVESKPLQEEQPKLPENPKEPQETVKEEKLPEPVTKPETVKEDPAQPEVPRIVTKASRKMYQNEEEIVIPSSSQESIASELESAAEDIKQEIKVEEELQQISEAFDSSVQISGPRPEVALKEFENISLSDEVPAAETEAKPIVVVEDQPPARETVSPTPQELSNDDSNSNNSSTNDSMKDMKSEQDDATIRRSSRIKTISSKNQRTSGHGLVKDKDKFLKKTTISLGIDTKVLKDAVTGNFNVISVADNSVGDFQATGEYDAMVTNIELSEEYLRDMEDKLARFETIRENMYHCDKVISKEAKKMMCDCFLTNEEIDRGELGCGEDCLNKLLMIECGSRCVIGERCTNKRFQKLEYANCQVFRTEKKGFGIQASTDIAPGEFIMEYVGEVLNSEQFDERAELYSKEKNKHYYFMALRSDAIIDATTKGNISRFINHSCDPNAETQKWTVNGELRIGFFSTKYIMPGEEVTFDYQFQRYGRKAQKCYCEAENCTGWIGGDPGSDGESEYEDEEEIEESEEEEETPPEVHVVVPVAPEVTPQEIIEPEAPKEPTEEIKPIVEGEPEVPTPIEPIVVKPPEPKVKKIRKRIERPKKRRPQIHEDPDLEKEINNLLKTGLKNQAHTLKLSRLMVRAKDIKSRSRLLTILQSGELPCRRLFLDYHGLRLLYGWICESTESVEDLKFRIQILDTLDRLPIPNKTMLKDSKILQTIEKWAKLEKIKEKEREVEKEKDKETSSTSSPSDSNGAGSDSNTSSDAKKQEVVGSVEVLKNMPELLKLADLGKLKEIISSTCTEKESSEKEKNSSTITEVIPSAASLMDSIEIPEPEDENAPEEKRLGTQIRILSCKLLISWINLKEVFRIPKKERIEQMKEHEREADLRYKALGLGDDDETMQRHSSSRFFDRSRELKRRKSVDDRELLGYKMKRPPSTAMDNLSKQQRRQLFEMKVAHEEAERRNKELWMQHENNCMKFGLNPHITPPIDVPAKMNPATGEYFSADDRLLPTPPSHVYFKVLPPPMPTNPEDYELPPMDLPPLWKFAIDERGRLYYYHVKDRVPQWEPPKKDSPPGPGQGLRDEDISMSSDSSTTDTEDSEEEYLNVQMEQLLKKKKKQQSSFNLDDVLAKPDDMNDDLSKTIKDLEAGDSSPRASSSAEKLFGDSLEKTAEELLQHRKRKHSNKLVQERIISPRTEEDKLYGQMEMKRYKETKEKLRRRKEEAKRLRARSMLDKSLSDSPFSGAFSVDALDKSAAESSLIDDDLVVSHKIVEDKCIVDELDILTKKKKISPYEEWQKVKQRLGKKRAGKLGESSTFVGASTSTASTSLGSTTPKAAKRKKTDKLDINSDEARKIKEKFRGEIAGVIVQHLSAYRKESCQSGRITNTEDFKHLARKLTHFVLLKELKHCDNTVNELEVTDSVRTKAREFIKKYMAKHGTIYVRGENEPDYANINL